MSLHFYLFSIKIMAPSLKRGALLVALDTTKPPAVMNDHGAEPTIQEFQSRRSRLAVILEEDKELRSRASCCELAPRPNVVHSKFQGSSLRADPRSDRASRGLTSSRDYSNPTPLLKGALATINWRLRSAELMAQIRKDVYATDFDADGPTSCQLSEAIPCSSADQTVGGARTPPDAHNRLQSHSTDADEFSEAPASRHHSTHGSADSILLGASWEWLPPSSTVSTYDPPCPEVSPTYLSQLARLFARFPAWPSRTINFF